MSAFGGKADMPLGVKQTCLNVRYSSESGHHRRKRHVQAFVVFKEAEQIWATVSSPISFPVTTSRVRKAGRSARI